MPTVAVLLTDRAVPRVVFLIIRRDKAVRKLHRRANRVRSRLPIEFRVELEWEFSAPRPVAERFRRHRTDCGDEIVVFLRRQRERLPRRTRTHPASFTATEQELI